MMQPDKEKHFWDANKLFIVIFVFFLISLITFILSPLTGDVAVFFASSQQADYIGENYINNAFKVWELKSVFSRTFFYFIYKAITPFFPLFTYSFAICAKLLFSLLTIGVVYFSVLYGFGRSNKKVVLSLSAIICSAIFATAIACHMQAEMIIVTILSAAFFLYMNACRTQKLLIFKLFLTGILIGSIFFFKSVFILMAVPFVAAIALYNEDASISIIAKHTAIIATGACIMLISGLILTHLINPNEIQEMLNASAYQATLFNVYANRNPFIVLAKFVFYGIFSLIAIPSITMAFFISCLMLTENLIKKQIFISVLRIVLWGVPFLIICLANRYFLYHYLIFAFVFVIEITLLFCKNKQEILYCNKFGFAIIGVMTLCFIGNMIFGNKTLLLVSTAVCFLFSFILLAKEVVDRIRHKEKNCSPALFFVMMCCILSFMNIYSIFSKNFHIYCRNMNSYYNANIEVKKAIDKNETILYLDDGLGAFTLGNKSFLKEYYPLPLQRLSNKKKYEKLESYRNAQQKALSYTGKYITVYEIWFFSDNKNLAIKEKLLTEYTLWKELTAYTIPFNMFSKNEYENFRKIQIYIRKEK